MNTVTKQEVVEFLKDVIFTLLTGDLTWKSHGVRKFTAKTNTLDDFIDETADQMLKDFSSYQSDINISNYIPCTETLHGEDHDQFDRELKLLFGIRNCDVCTRIMPDDGFGIKNNNPRTSVSTSKTKQSPTWRTTGRRTSFRWTAK